MSKGEKPGISVYSRSVSFHRDMNTIEFAVRTEAKIIGTALGTVGSHRTRKVRSCVGGTRKDGSRLGFGSMKAKTESTYCT